MIPKGVPKSLHWALCQVSEEYMNVVELERPCGMWLHEWEYKGLFQIPFSELTALIIIGYWKVKGFDKKFGRD